MTGADYSSRRNANVNLTQQTAAKRTLAIVCPGIEICSSAANEEKKKPACWNWPGERVYRCSSLWRCLLSSCVCETYAELRRAQRRWPPGRSQACGRDANCRL